MERQMLGVFAEEQRVFLPEKKSLQALKPKYFNHKIEETAPKFAKRVFDYMEALAKRSRKEG